MNEALGRDITLYYIGLLVVPFIWFAYLFQTLDWLGVKLSRSETRLLLGVSYVVLCGGGFWQLLRRPRRPSLVLHERGFRYKRTLVEFGELSALRIGRDMASFESAMAAASRTFGRISPVSAWTADTMERTADGSVTLVFKTGETKSLNALLIKTLPEDLDRFFEELNARHPGLVK